ncbi:MAG: VPLPA-CTERM sorting domain-containing protein [Gammaproteobacteria bacterium]|nr:VPLPA-CTERM sorting domain-containing protein [Gammaproteobacteria bacterium]MDH5593508.1 VPLPA-CTERM sorting domain-containing protein [Gammaproteobacteria bacterium]
MELWGDFSDEPTLGGGLDIFYDDTVLDFLSWDTSGSGFFLDPAFSRNPDELAGELEGFAFGNFGGLSGIAKIGSLTFEAIGAGDFIMSMAVTDDPLKGGDFVSAMTYGVQTITFGSSDISVSAVPVPAAIWLFGSGLIGLAGIMRRRNG